MPNLFELIEGLYGVVQVADAAGHEEDSDELIDGWVESVKELLEDKIEDKLDGIRGIRRQLGVEAQMARDEAEIWRLKAKAMENRSDRLGEYGAKVIKALPKITAKKGPKKGKLVYQTLRGKFSHWVQETPTSFDEDLVDIVAATEAGFVDFKPKVRLKELTAQFDASGELPPGCDEALKPKRWTLRAR